MTMKDNHTIVQLLLHYSNIFCV